jgi:hypothetical protein
VTTIGANKVTGAKIATGSSGITASNLDTTGSASATTFLNGNFAWATPSTAGASLTVSSTHTGTLIGTSSMFVTVTDGGTVQLPAATTAGQQMYIVSAAGSSTALGFTITVGSGDTLTQQDGQDNSGLSLCTAVSDGAHKWWTLACN